MAYIKPNQAETTRRTRQVGWSMDYIMKRDDGPWLVYATDMADPENGIEAIEGEARTALAQMFCQFPYAKTKVYGYDGKTVIITPAQIAISEARKWLDAHPDLGVSTETGHAEGAEGTPFGLAMAYFHAALTSRGEKTTPEAANAA